MAYPVGLVDGPLRRSLALIIAAGLPVAALTAVAAYAVGRRIARPISVATAAAQALTRGERVPVAASAVREVAQLGDALERSADLLRRREAERDHLLAETETARREAEAASRAKDDFLAMLGHELRNPLGAIASAVGVLDLRAGLPATAERARTVIRRQVQHLSRLVDDLLDVTRVTTGKVTLDQAPVDLGELVTQVVAVWRVSGRFDRHEVSLQVSPVWVDADATRIEQVVSNILDNALKYTPPGGHVGIRVENRGGTATIEVADTGVGIAPALIEKMFDPFVQGDRGLDRAQGGLGIGLTLVRTLVGMHGGTVEAHSDGAGRGAVFAISLPCITPPAGATRLTSVATVGRPRRVLVVEDNDDAREMVRTALTVAGHEVHEAADGRVAVAMAAAVVPDVAIVDIGLPGLDGYDVARAIRAGHGGRSVLLIAMTGYGQTEDCRRALDAGFDAHLIKPVDPDRLAELVAGGAREGSIRS
jgi:signal transduction histidine kinase/ActR/RegA family two-component response regulator